MKRPLFLIFVGLVLGEAAAMMTGMTGYLTMALSLPLLCTLCPERLLRSPFFSCFLTGKSENEIRTWRRTAALTGLVIGLSLLAGGARASFQEWLTDSDPGLALLRKGEIKQGNIVGNIDRIGREKEGEYQIILERGAVFARGDEQVVFRYKIKVYCETEEKLLAGDRVKLEGRLEEADLPTNPGQFDQRRYEYAYGIHYHLMARSVRIMTQGRPGLKRLAWQVRTRIEEIFAKSLPQREAGLLAAMVFGDKTGLREEDRRMYEENGSSHLLAVSGLHCSLISGRIYAFFRKRKLSYPLSCFLGAFFLLFYALMTGGNSSVIRASIMYIAYLVSELFGFEYDLPSAMSLSGMIMAAEQPERILEGGWIISFTAVGAIGFFIPLAKDLIRQRRKESLAPGELTGEEGILVRIRDSMISGALLSMITGPVVACIFYEWCPCSIILNVILLPAMGPLLVSAMSGGLLGLLSPLMARPSCLVCLVILRLFRALFSLSSRLPFSLIVTGHFPPALLVLIYGAEALLFLFWYRRKYWYSAGLVLVILSFCFLTGDYSLKVHMLDVGQGDCILLCFPGGEDILIDGGSTSRKNIGTYVIRPALKYYGIASLDYVVLTHMDEDHICGIKELMDQDYPIGALILPALSKEDAAYDQMEEAADHAGCPVLKMGRGDRLRVKDAMFHCLNPVRGKEIEDRNEGSVTLFLEAGSFDGLFTGDIGQESEKDILSYLKKRKEEYPTLADGLSLLKVAHHGSAYSSAQELVDYLRPQAALISCGEKNRYGHPSPETLERLQEAGAKIARTDRGGAVTAGPEGISQWRPEKAD